MKQTNEILGNKKLSSSIERIGVDEFNCKYNYKFSTSQWLESIDNPEYFGISHDDMKDNVIEILVDEFRTQLKNIIYDKISYTKK